MLILKNFQAGIQDKEILHGIDLAIRPGEVHAIMGPNGAGKSTLAMSLMGNPNYKFKILASQRSGQSSRLAAKRAEFKINDTDMLNLLPEERAKQGLFVSFQNPIEITGVSFLAFLRTAAKALRPDEKKPLAQFKTEVAAALAEVNLPSEFMQRSVNEGFSGGERKRAEIAQLLVLKPHYAILDEIDSGLDVDSLKVVAKAVAHAVKEQNIGILLITHYQRILHFLKPNKVHILIEGKIKKSGGMSLVRIIEKEGYATV